MSEEGKGEGGDERRKRERGNILGTSDKMRQRKEGEGKERKM